MNFLARIRDRGRQRGWRHFFKRDACRFCRGAKGGTPGNENILPGGVVACDYCTCLAHRVVAASK